MSFEENEIQVKPYLCDPESIISYHETLLDKENTVWVGSLTATKALITKEFKKMVSYKYHAFLRLFRELFTKQLPPHHSFNH
jgi:hypothetical protein